MQTVGELSSASRDLALHRFRLLEPHLEHDRPLSVIAAEAGIPFRTVQRWAAQYRRFGLAALARKMRVDNGVRRGVSATLKAAIEGLALERPPLPITSIYRQVKQFAASTGESTPSYWTVYRVVRDLPEGLLTLAHRGNKAYSESFDLVHRREASKPNAIWQADHAQLDILLLREDGNTARPWLTIVIDDFSRAITGYYFGFDPPSSLRTSLALRQGIWRKDHPHWHICGIPEVLYTDNGSDFTSKHLEQVAVDLKIRLIFSTPGKPQGRGRVERFFRTLNEMFLCDLDGCTRRSNRKPKLTLGQLEALFRTFLLDIYHKRVGSEGRLAPSDRWEHGGFLPRMPESLEQLDLLLMQEIRARKVRRDGIHFQGLRYLSLTLAAYVGEDVTIRFDPRDMGEIRVFHRDRFLCRAISSELAGETIPLRDIIRVRNRRRKELRSILHDRKKLVDTLLQLKQGPVPEEVHAIAVVAASPAVRIKRYRSYSRSEMIVSFDRWTSQSRDQLPINTIFYITSVVNTPSRIETDLGMARERLMGIAMNPIRLEAKEVLDAIRLRDEARRREILNRPGCSPCDRPPVDPTYFKTFELYEARKKAIPDPTTLLGMNQHYYL